MVDNYIVKKKEGQVGKYYNNIVKSFLVSNNAKDASYDRFIEENCIENIYQKFMT